MVVPSQMKGGIERRLIVIAVRQNSELLQKAE
jgi:hypothetical protein